MQPLVRESDVPDWYVLSSWQPVWDRLRLAPQDIPGIRELPNGVSARKPFPREIHRSHLPIIKSAGFPQVLTIANSTAGLNPWGPEDGLYDHQIETIGFLRGRRGTLLASEQRTGKTPSIMYAFEPERGPMLVVGPVAARAVWHEWAARRFGGCVDVQAGHACPTCARVGATASARPSFVALEGRAFRPELLASRPHVLFCTFAVVSTWRELSMSLLGAADVARLGMLVVDEAHLGGVQNRKSLTVESLKWLNAIADRVVCATGTPLYNKVQGLWPLLDLCAPTAFGGYWDFARRYCAARPTEHGWRADGVSHEDELKSRLSEIMFRRTWTEIRGDLPKIQRAAEIVPLKEEVRDQIDELAARLRYESGGSKTQVGILARLRRLFADAKLPAGFKSVVDTLGQGHSCIAWTWHLDVAEKLAEQLQRKGLPVYGPITGKMSPSERERELDAARVDQRPRVLVANMAALATAVNLSWASHEIFLELDWTPTTIAQAEMRPFDGKNAVASTLLVADCATDEALVEALLSKLETQKSLGLAAGVGDVSDVLRRTFKLEGQSLARLAERLCENAEGEI